MSVKWTDVVTALGTLAIPVALYFAADTTQEAQRRIAVETRTLDLMNDMDRRVSKIVSDKVKSDAQHNKLNGEQFRYDYISSDKAVEGLVFQLLNEYDYLCLGANEGLLSTEIVKRIRGDALKQTWHDYDGYVKAHRASKPAAVNAWSECDAWLKKNVS